MRPGATVADVAAGVERAEVAAGGDVVGTKREVDTDCFEDAPADVKAVGVVAEEGEVAGAAAGRDAHSHRGGQADV